MHTTCTFFVLPAKYKSCRSPAKSRFMPNLEVGVWVPAQRQNGAFRASRPCALRPVALTPHFHPELLLDQTIGIASPRHSGANGDGGFNSTGEVPPQKGQVASVDLARDRIITPGPHESTSMRSGHATMIIEAWKYALCKYTKSQGFDCHHLQDAGSFRLFPGE